MPESKAAAPHEGEDAPIIPYVDEDSLDEEGQAVLKRIRHTAGFVPNSIWTYLHRPEIARVVLDVAGAVNRSPKSTLESSIKPKLGIICSSVNGCLYCTSHQCNFAQNMSGIGFSDISLSEAEILALISGEDEGKNEIERVCFEFARVASENPSRVTVDLLERMKRVLTPAQIVELAGVVGSWKFYNTVHDSLHIPREAQMARYSHMLDGTPAHKAADARRVSE